jgi:hypothetical protein
MRNVDEIKRLEYELGRYKKMVGDRDKQIEKLEQQLNGAVGEVRMMMDAHLIRTCLKYGYAEEFDGVLYEHCLLLETDNPEKLVEEWELKRYTGEKKGQLIVQAVKREVSLLNTVEKQGKEA